MVAGQSYKIERNQKTPDDDRIGVQMLKLGREYFNYYRLLFSF